MLTLDHLIGCVLGECAGDALGFPVEGMPPAVCADHVQRVVLGDERPENAHQLYCFGQYTDDSQLMRELLQSYVASRGFAPADYAGRIAAIFDEDRIVGRGAATERAAERISQGVSWEESGEPAPVAGNGSAMRAGVVGMLARDDDELVKMAVDQGRITHADPRASAGAVVVAAACARAAVGEVAVSEIVTLVRPVDARFASYLEEMPRWLTLSPEEAAKEIGVIGQDARFVSDRWQGISPFVVGSVLWSLYSYLRHPGSWLEAVACAVAVGGDVDTTGAMTGAIAGARHGAPEWILDRLTDRGTWEREDLVTLAKQAWEIRQAR